jgi:hypothetical protein
LVDRVVVEALGVLRICLWNWLSMEATEVMEVMLFI